MKKDSSNDKVEKSSTGISQGKKNEKANSDSKPSRASSEKTPVVSQQNIDTAKSSKSLSYDKTSETVQPNDTGGQHHSLYNAVYDSAFTSTVTDEPVNVQSGAYSTNNFASTFTAQKSSTATFNQITSDIGGSSYHVIRRNKTNDNNSSHQKSKRRVLISNGSTNNIQNNNHYKNSNNLSTPVNNTSGKNKITGYSLYSGSNNTSSKNSAASNKRTKIRRKAGSKHNYGSSFSSSQNQFARTSGQTSYNTSPTRPKIGKNISVAILTGVKVISPFHQTQIHFTKTQLANGTFKTNWKIVPTRNFSKEEHRGIFNKTYHLKDRLKGDVPSLTKKLNSIKPKSKALKFGAFTLRNTYKVSKFTFKTVVNAERAAFFISDVISPFRQFQVERVQKANGKFGYKIKSVRRKNVRISEDGRFHGVLNAIYYLNKNKVQGDVPSLTKNLNSILNSAGKQSVKKIVGVSSVKGGYTLVKSTGKLTLFTVLGTERAIVLLSKKAINFIKRKLSDELGQTDTGKALLKLRAVGRFVGEQNAFRKQYKEHKRKIKLREKEARLIKKTINHKLKKISCN